MRFTWYTRLLIVVVGHLICCWREFAERSASSVELKPRAQRPSRLIGGRRGEAEAGEEMIPVLKEIQGSDMRIRSTEHENTMHHDTGHRAVRGRVAP